MAPGLLALTLAAALGSSKLGVVVGGDWGTAPAPAAQIITACPRIGVFPVNVANRSAVIDQVRAFRAACAGASVILQVGGRGLPVGAQTASTLWFQEWLGLVLGVEGVEGVEGPWDATGSADDVAAFWGQFAVVVSGSTYLPVVGAFAPGVPDGAGTPNDASCAPLARVRSAVSRFAISFRARAAALTTSSDPALAYRQVVIDCALPSGTPIFFTEVTPATGQWSQADVTWLSWLDGQLVSSDVVGAAAYAVGVSGPLDLSAVATPFIALLTNPGGGGGGGGGGGPGGGGTVNPSPGDTGTLSPPPPKQGCATGGTGASLLALLPLLAPIRRRFKG